MSANCETTPLLQSGNTPRMKEGPIWNIFESKGDQKYSYLQDISFLKGTSLKVVAVHALGYGLSNLSGLLINELELKQTSSSLENISVNFSNENEVKLKKIVKIDSTKMAVARCSERYFAIGTTKGKIELYTFYKKMILEVNFTQKFPITHLALTKEYFCGALTKKMKIWKLNNNGTADGSDFGGHNPFTSTLIRTVSSVDKGEIYALDIKEGGKKVAVAFKNGSVSLIDISDSNLDIEFEVNSKITCLKVLDDNRCLIGTDKGAILATLSDKTIDEQTLCGDSVFSVAHEEGLLMLGMKQAFAFYEEVDGVFKRVFERKVNIDPCFIGSFEEKNCYFFGDWKGFTVFSKTRDFDYYQSK